MFYIDFICCLEVLDNGIKYAGGTNYAISLMKTIIKSNRLKSENITILLPKGCSNKEIPFYGLEEEQETEQLYADSLLDINFVYDSTLFIPQVNGKTLLIIPKIRKKQPKLNIYATLHDRQHNFYKFDWYDRYYYNGFRRFGVYDFALFYIKRMLFNLNYSRCVKCIDELITVSNYSMQKLVGKNVKKINYYIQKSVIEPYKRKTNRGDYILFVSGGRPEKNLLRTLEAFALFKKDTNSDIKIVVTGVSDKIMDNLVASGKIKTLINYTDIVCYPYVSYEQLVELYADCRYVVFPSKGEGYGLPVREALEYGKTVLASRTTSVPEVAGCILYYIDPFNVQSICDGFKFFDKDENLDKYESYLNKRMHCMKQIEEQDEDVLLDILLTDKRI